MTPLPRFQLHLLPDPSVQGSSPAFTHHYAATQQAIIHLLNACVLLRPVRIPIITTLASAISDFDPAYVQHYDTELREEMGHGTSCTFIWATQGTIGFEDLPARIPGAQYVVLFELKTSLWNLWCLALANALVMLMETCMEWGSDKCTVLSAGFRFSRQRRVNGLLVFDDNLAAAFQHVKHNAEQGSLGFCLHRYPEDTVFATRWLGKQSFAIDASVVEDMLCYARESYYRRRGHPGGPSDGP